MKRKNNQNSDLKEKKTKKAKIIAFATVGGSPLPVYINLMDLINNCNSNNNLEIVFIETKESSSISANLKKIIEKDLELGKKINFEHLQIDLNEGSKAFKKEFHAKLKGDKNSCKIEKCYFLYTGGTKLMVIQFLLEVIKFKIKFPFFLSYLDPKKQQIVINRINNKWIKKDSGKIFAEKINPIDKKLSLDLKKLVSIHGIKLVSTDNSINQNLLRNKKLVKELLNGYITSEKDKILKKIEIELNNRKDVDFWLAEKNQHYISYLKKEFRKMVRELQLEEYTASIFSKKNKNQIQEELKKLLKFLRGEWLEEITYLSLKEEEKNKKKIYKNVVIENEGRIAEIDVIIIEGLNSTIVSITSSRKMGLIKLKMFEAIHRANQIGGIRSKIMIVTLAEKWMVEQLKRDISQFEQIRRISILGKKETIELINKRRSGKI